MIQNCKVSKNPRYNYENQEKNIFHNEKAKSLLESQVPWSGIYLHFLPFSKSFMLKELA